jgi:hypothetical protein
MECSLSDELAKSGEASMFESTGNKREALTILKSSIFRR